MADARAPKDRIHLEGALRLNAIGGSWNFKVFDYAPRLYAGTHRNEVWTSGHQHLRKWNLSDGTITEAHAVTADAEWSPAPSYSAPQPFQFCAERRRFAGYVADKKLEVRGLDRTAPYVSLETGDNQFYQLSGDGTRLLTEVRQGAFATEGFQVWDVEKGTPCIPLLTGATHACINHDGSLVASLSKDEPGTRSMRFYRGENLTKELSWSVAVDGDGGADELHFSPNGSFVLVEFYRGHPVLARVDGSTITLTDVPQSVSCRCISPDDRWILFCFQNEALLVDTNTGQLAARFGELSLVTAATFLTPSTLLVVRGNLLSTFDVHTERMEVPVNGAWDQLRHVHFNRAGNEVLSIDHLGLQTHRWNTADGTCLSTFEASCGQFVDAVFHPNETTIVAVTDNPPCIERIEVANSASMEVQTLTMNESLLRADAIELSASGEFVLINEWHHMFERRVSVWDLSAHSIRFSTNLEAVAWGRFSVEDGRCFLLRNKELLVLDDEFQSVLETIQFGERAALRRWLEVLAVDPHAATLTSKHSALEKYLREQLGLLGNAARSSVEFTVSKAPHPTHKTRIAAELIDGRIDLWKLRPFQVLGSIRLDAVPDEAAVVAISNDATKLCVGTFRGVLLFLEIV